MQKTFIKIFFLCLVIGQSVQAQFDQPVDRILVKLEDQIVLESEVEKMYLNLKQEGRITQEDDPHLRKCELLEFLVTNQLMLAVAYKDSVKIATEIVDLQLDDRFKRFENWSEEDFKKAFGKTKDDIRKELYPIIEQQLMTQKMERNLVGSISVTPQEVKDHFKGVSPTEMPQLESEVEVAQILLIPSQSTDLKYQYGAQPTQGQARVFLDSLKNEILIDNIPFEEAARSYSNDDFTAPNGGYFLNPTGGQKVFSSELDSYVYFTLDTMKVGSISPVLNYRGDNGEEGCRILYLKSRIPAHTATFEKDFDKLKLIALQAKRDRYIRDWFRKNISEFALEVDEDYKDCVFKVEK